MAEGGEDFIEAGDWPIVGFCSSEEGIDLKPGVDPTAPMTLIPVAIAPGTPNIGLLFLTTRVFFLLGVAQLCEKYSSNSVSFEGA
jgi:hypothetical protein